MATLLLAGQLMQAIAGIPYYVALAHGNVRLYLYIGAVSIVLVVPLLIILIRKIGVVGAGLSWLVMNLCTLPLYLYFFHRQFLPGELRRWCLHDIGLPLLATLPCVLLGRWLVPHTTSRLLTFFLIALVWCAATAASALGIPELRSEFIIKTKKLLRVFNEI